MSKIPARARIAAAKSELLEKAATDPSTELTISELARTAKVTRGTIYKHTDLLEEWTRDVRQIELSHLNLANLELQNNELSQELKRLKDENRQLRAQLKSIQIVAAEMSALLIESEHQVNSRVVQFKRKN